MMNYLVIAIRVSSTPSVYMLNELLISESGERIEDKMVLIVGKCNLDFLSLSEHIFYLCAVFLLSVYIIHDTARTHKCVRSSNSFFPR